MKDWNLFYGIIPKIQSIGRTDQSAIKKSCIRFTAVTLAMALLMGWPALKAAAQTAGEGAIQGTVTDSTGATVANATITATNIATNISTERVSQSSGAYTISPLLPGTYRLKIAATGFQSLIQDNVVVNALQIRTVNPVLSVGSVAETVTVSAAPPVLNTADATLGMTVENETYANLPIQMNNAQRDPTAFATLTPGTQGGTRLPVVGGTGNYLGQLYLDGMPAQTVNQQGDNRLVSQALSVEAVDQFQVLTSTPPAEYMGAGAENFTMKSGSLKYHGQVSDFVRNTAFDSWAFTTKEATTKNALGQTVPAPKSVEHQNELSVSGGGVVPFTNNKLFFFAAYDKFYSRKGATYNNYTVPSTLMRNGDFTELNGNPGSGLSGTGSDNKALIYDPTSNTCSGGTCSRTPFQGIKNGVPTYNVIPASMISPISKAMQSFLPAPTNSSSLTNNYTGGMPSGFDNHLVDWRVDYDLSSKQRISTIGAMGDVNYLNNFGSGGSGTTTYGFLPLPYTGGDYADIHPKNFAVEDTYIFSPNLVNQLKFNFTRFFQNIKNATQGVKQYEPAALGITNIPQGQAGEEFPGAQFGTVASSYGSTAMTGWTMNSSAASTQLTTPNNYALVDNLQWLKGKHAFTFGITYQWQQINNANPATYSSTLSLAYNAYSTANFGANSTSLSTSSSGFSYASYLLGAVGGSAAGGSAPTLALQPVSELGGRFHPFAPYVTDTYKVTPKLTLELGLRWDYLPPFHEVQDRWTFLNPNLTNGITGTPGELQFAGKWGGSGVSCGCRTPVKTYYGNWGPRIGLAYSLSEKTVIRAGIAQVFSQAGGVGGRAGAAGGTGQTGFNMTATGPTEVLSGASAGPSYYLNNSAGFTSLGLANTDLFGKGYSYPSAPAQNAAAQTLNTGYYLDGTGTFHSASSVSYADPYLSGRAPEIELYNFGVEHGITSDMTLAVNFVGNESHFIVNSGTTGSNMRGYWANQLNPQYLAALGPLTDSGGKNPLLTSPATAANVAKLAAVMPGAPSPSFFMNAAAKSSSATIAQMLVAFPQYSSVSDLWGNAGNFSYNSLQITLLQRMSHGLSFNINYTYSKNVGDDGTFRSGFPIPAAAISHGTKNWRQDRIERSWTAISVPSVFHAFGVYQLPFGKGKLGSNSWWVRTLAGGWQLSGIYTFNQGTPMAVVWSGCSSSNTPGQGQCMPDLNSAYGKPDARINGKFGSGPKGTNACNLGIGTGCKAVQYVDGNGFSAPQNVSSVSSAQYLLGNAPRTRPLNLRNPGFWNLDTGLRRSFPLYKEGLKFVFEADSLNTLNHTNFANPSASWASGSSTFGTISGTSSSYSPRDFQFAGHITF